MRREIKHYDSEDDPSEEDDEEEESEDDDEHEEMDFLEDCRLDFINANSIDEIEDIINDVQECCNKQWEGMHCNCKKWELLEEWSKKLALSQENTDFVVLIATCVGFAPNWNAFLEYPCVQSRLRIYSNPIAEMHWAKNQHERFLEIVQQNMFNHIKTLKDKEKRHVEDRKKTKIDRERAAQIEQEMLAALQEDVMQHSGTTTTTTTTAKKGGLTLQQKNISSSSGGAATNSKSSSPVSVPPSPISPNKPSKPPQQKAATQHRDPVKDHTAEEAAALQEEKKRHEEKLLARMRTNKQAAQSTQKGGKKDSWHEVGAKHSGKGSASPFANASAANSPQTHVTVEMRTYNTIRCLFTVILLQKLRKKFRDVHLTVEEMEMPADQRGNPMVKVTFHVAGGKRSASQCEALLKDYATNYALVKKHEFKIKEQIDKRRLEMLPQNVGCVVNYLFSKKVFLMSVIPLPGEEVDVSEMEEEVREFLTAQSANQQFRTKGGDYQEEEEYYEEGYEEQRDGNSPYQRKRGTFNHHHHDAEDGGSSLHHPREHKTYFSPAKCKTELARINKLPYEEALPELHQLVESMRYSGQQHILPWLKFLYDVEQQYALAVLAQYELHGVRLQRADLFDEMVKIELDPSGGLQPFTERRPSVQIDDSVKILLANGKFVELKIHLVDTYHVLLHATKQEMSECLGGPVSVIFDPLPYSYRCQMMQHATGFTTEFTRLCTRAPSGLNAEQFAESTPATTTTTTQRKSEPRVATAKKSHCDGLTDNQKTCVRIIIDPPEGLKNFYISGPAGTGKTETICRSIAELLTVNPHQKILFTAPTHSAVDVVMTRLLEIAANDSLLDSSCFCRLFPKGRSPLKVDPSILPYSNLQDPNKPFGELTPFDRFKDPKEMNPDFFDNTRVLLCTTSLLNQVQKLHMDLSAYTYLFLDEAAQAHLAEGLIALRTAPSNAFLVLAGDENQVRPHCLARFIATWVQRSPAYYAKQNQVFQIRLHDSFRQSTNLCKFQSILFYRGQLRHHPLGNVSDSVAKWSGHGGKPKSVRFIHNEGPEKLEGSSLKNDSEVDLISKIFLTLVAETPLSAKDVVIICSYTEQRKAIRQRIALYGQSNVKAVEIMDYQGDEAEVVIVALTTSKPEELMQTQDLNTAMSRARSLVLIVGNGNVALQSTYRAWHSVLEHLEDDEAIDGYNYDTQEFNEKLRKKLDMSRVELTAREFVPKTAKKENLERRIVTRQTVCSSPGEFFVGIVYVPRKFDEIFIRNRTHCGVDVMMDKVSASGQCVALVFPGETVAVRVDPSLARARQSKYFGTMAQSLKLISQEGLEPHADPEGMFLKELDGKPLTAQGSFSSIIESPVYLPIPGNACGAMVYPHDTRFPPLPFLDRNQGIPLTPDAKQVLAWPKRDVANTGIGRPYYEICYLNPGYPISSKELPMGLLKAPQTPYKQYQAFVFDDRYFNCLISNDGTRAEVQIFVPNVTDSRCVDDRQLKTAYHRCFAQAHETPLLEMSFKSYLPVFVFFIEVSLLERRILRKYCELGEVLVRDGTPQDTHQIQLQRELLMESFEGRASDEALRGRYGNVWDWLIGDIAATKIFSFFPKGSLFVRQHRRPLEFDSLSPKTMLESAKLFDNPEWFTPVVRDSPIPKQSEIIIDGIHAPSGLHQFVSMSYPNKRYADILVQQLLCLTFLRANQIPMADIEMLNTMREHARRINVYAQYFKVHHL